MRGQDALLSPNNSSAYFPVQYPPSPVADQGNSFSQLVSWELGNKKVRVIIDLLTPSGVIINTNEEGGQQCKI